MLGALSRNFGAQGAGAADVLDAFLTDDSGAPQGALVNSSRGITFAWRNEKYADLDWKDAASTALDAMIAELGPAYSTRT